MGTMDHEVYPNAPVALVTVEIRFPGEIGGPIPPGVQRALGDALGDDWVPEPISIATPRIAVNLGGAGQPPLVAQPSAFPSSALLRFSDRERGTAVALTGGSISVETTRYENWPQFRSTLSAAVEIADKLLHPAGVIRAGVRYIDEIRVEGIQGGDGWGAWLSPSLLPPVSSVMVDEGYPPVQWTGGVQYRLGEDRQLVLHFGPQGPQPGYAVNPDGPLRRPGRRPVGPFFLLDFDASWQPTVIPRWDSPRLLETCDELRRPVRMLFDHLVTDRLVEEVFKKELT